MNIDDELRILKTQTILRLWNDTPNINEYLKKQRNINPKNWQPWILFLINMYNKMVKK